MATIASNEKIRLIDIENQEAQEYNLNSDDTIKDLKFKVAQQDGYNAEDFDKKIHILIAGFILPNDLLVKDLLKLGMDFFVQFLGYAQITCMADKNIYVWLGDGYARQQLYAGVSETFQMPWNGFLAVCRNE